MYILYFFYVGTFEWDFNMVCIWFMWWIVVFTLCLHFVAKKVLQEEEVVKSKKHFQLGTNSSVWLGTTLSHVEGVPLSKCNAVEHANKGMQFGMHLLKLLKAQLIDICRPKA